MFNLLATPVKTVRGASSTDWGFHKTTKSCVPKKSKFKEIVQIAKKKKTCAFFVHNAKSTREGRVQPYVTGLIYDTTEQTSTKLCTDRTLNPVLTIHKLDSRESRVIPT